jgi:hypothetical protein
MRPIKLAGATAATINYNNIEMYGEKILVLYIQVVMLTQLIIGGEQPMQIP